MPFGSLSPRQSSSSRARASVRHEPSRSRSQSACLASDTGRPTVGRHLVRSTGKGRRHRHADLAIEATVRAFNRLILRAIDPCPNICPSIWGGFLANGLEALGRFPLPVEVVPFGL